MANIDLSKYGITGVKEIVYNPSYEALFQDEMDPSLTGYAKGQLSELGAVNVMTGIYTGRSPKDKYIVMDENSKDTVWWTTDAYKNDNHPMTESTWSIVRDLARKELSGKKLYVVDAFCGANKDTRMAVRFVMEVAWQAHFVRNMFIQPTEEELATFEPNFVVYTASLAKCENYFNANNYDKALNGDGQGCVGFLQVAKEFSSTKAGNLAHLYSGICYAQTEKWEEAKAELEKFSTKDDAIISPASLGLLGNVYANLGQNDKAIEYLLKAAKMADNNSLSPSFLIQAGELYEAQGNPQKALNCYRDLSILQEW